MLTGNQDGLIRGDLTTFANDSVLLYTPASSNDFCQRFVSPVENARWNALDEATAESFE